MELSRRTVSVPAVGGDLGDPRVQSPFCDPTLGARWVASELVNEQVFPSSLRTKD